MAMLRGVDLHMDMANGELTIHLPDGRNIAFAARAYVGDVLIALEQHAAQQASGGWITSPVLGLAPMSGNAALGQHDGEEYVMPNQPQPTPCYWCGNVTGHAPSCAAAPHP